MVGPPLSEDEIQNISQDTTINLALEQPTPVQTSPIQVVEKSTVVVEKPWYIPTILSDLNVFPKSKKKGDNFSIVIIVLLVVVLLYLFTRK